MRRTLLLVALLGAYGAWSLRSLAHGADAGAAFDPFMPAARALELRIESGLFADALPLAVDLARAYPRAPETAMSLARVHHGLGQPAREADDWEAYIALGMAPVEACPSLPQAYASAGQRDRALEAYERCARFDRDDGDRLIDLGDAYAAANRPGDAAREYERARLLDPSNPFLAARIERLRMGRP